jgi:serine-type D-Ala-D-Ala carboxypeptidase (penicillin-binding protein 5/6)
LLKNFSNLFGLGYNDKNKQSVITTVTKGNQRLLPIMLDFTVENIWNDSINLLEYGFNNFAHGVLINNNQRLKV